MYRFIRLPPHPILTYWNIDDFMKEKNISVLDINIGSEKEIHLVECRISLQLGHNLFSRC